MPHDLSDIIRNIPSYATTFWAYPLGFFENRRIEVSKCSLPIHSWLNFDFWVSKTQFLLPSRSKLTKKKSKFASKFHNLFIVDHMFEAFARVEAIVMFFCSLLRCR
jgi:hypothetical protein